MKINQCTLIDKLTYEICTYCIVQKDASPGAYASILKSEYSYNKAAPDAVSQLLDHNFGQIKKNLTLFSFRSCVYFGDDRPPQRFLPAKSGKSQRRC